MSFTTINFSSKFKFSIRTWLVVWHLYTCTFSIAFHPSNDFPNHAVNWNSKSNTKKDIANFFFNEFENVWNSNGPDFFYRLQIKKRIISEDVYVQQFGFRVTTKLEHLHILSVKHVSSNLSQLQLIVNTFEHMNTLQMVVVVISERHN